MLWLVLVKWFVYWSVNYAIVDWLAYLLVIDSDYNTNIFFLISYLRYSRSQRKQKVHTKVSKSKHIGATTWYDRTLLHITMNLKKNKLERMTVGIISNRYSNRNKYVLYIHIYIYKYILNLAKLFHIVAMQLHV